MTIAATFVSSTQFTVSGDHEAGLPVSLIVKCFQGVDGIAYAAVQSVSYDGGSGLTTCTLDTAVLTANLTEIRRSRAGFADSSSSATTLQPHPHTDRWTGGAIDAAGLSAAEVALVQSFPVTGGGNSDYFLKINGDDDGYEVVDLFGSANQILGMNAAGDDLEEKTLVGTADQVTMTHSGDSITFSTPQNIGTASSPTFDTITATDAIVSNHTGVLFGNSGSVLSSESATGALQCLRRNSGNDDYEFAVPVLKDLSDVAAEASDSMTQGDLLLVNATPKVDRLPISGTAGDALLSTGTTAAWGEIDGDKLDIDWTPSNYTPDATPAESDDVDDLTAHLYGIDVFLGTAELTANKGAVSGYCGLDGSGLVDGDDLPAASVSKKGAVPVLENTGTKVLYDDGSWAAPPGAAGGEANTASNIGGGTGVYEQKVAVDLQFNTFDSTQFTETSNVIQLVVAAPGPDYTPPAFKYKDADEITIVAGKYWPLGYRLDGQYQDENYVPWTVTEFDVDVDAAGNLIGGDVVSSWYSVFMDANNSCIILPFIRVDTRDYNVSNALKTTINPADHDDGTTANDSFVSAADDFNTYRLLLLSDTSYHGSIYTIEDTVDGTPDEIIIDGDVSAEIDEKAWLQMIPPAGTDCLYLGCIRLDSSGDLQWFKKDDWFYQLPERIWVAGTLNLTPALSDLAPAAPPTATNVLAGCRILSGGSATAIVANMYRGTSGSDITEQIFPIFNAPADDWGSSMTQIFPLSAIGHILNSFQMDTGSFVAATDGDFLVTGFKE